MAGSENPELDGKRAFTSGIAEGGCVRTDILGGFPNRHPWLDQQTEAHPPVVTASSMITVKIDRGDNVQTYEWTRAEASMIRDVLDGELGRRPATNVRSLG